MMDNKYFVPVLTLIIVAVVILALGLAIQSGKFKGTQEQTVNEELPQEVPFIGE